MGPDLADDAVLDDGDPVGVVGGVQPVGDRDDRAALDDGGERPLEVTRGPRVEQRGRLVEHEGVRVGQHEPGEGQLLGLGLGEPVTAGADGRVEAVRQRQRPLPGVDRGERAAQLLSVASGRASRRLSSSVPTKTWCSCVTRATSPRSSRQLEVDEPHPADVDPPRPRPVDAGHAAGRGSTCPPRRARRWPAAHRGEVERDSVQDVAAGTVGVADVVDVDVLAVGRSPVAARSGGTSATPMTRASEVAPTWISSSQEMSSSSGPAICWT